MLMQDKKQGDDATATPASMSDSASSTHATALASTSGIKRTKVRKLPLVDTVILFIDTLYRM